MAVITYRTPTTRQAARNIVDTVILDGRIVGHIKIVDGGGFAYYPKGKLGGHSRICATPGEVRQVIEGTEPQRNSRR